MASSKAWWLAGAAAYASVASAATVKASSEGTDPGGVRHPAAAAWDGDLGTSWAEGAEGSGEGQWVELRLDKPTLIRSLSLWAGDLRELERSAKSNPMVRGFTVSLEVDGEPVTQRGTVPPVSEAGLQRVDVSFGEAGVLAKAVRVTIDSTFNGYDAADCHVAELALNFGVQGSPETAAFDAWLAGDATAKSAAKHREQVIATFDAVQSAEFGDMDKLRVLMDWAMNGAPYLAEKVRRDVPLGWRVQALPPDDVAVEALLKIKDGNAVTALELAALRTRGRKARELHDAARYLAAYTELKGVPRRNLEMGGETGWEKGALRGFGEPLALAQTSGGDVLVADVANHRLSVFAPDGAFRGTLGAGQADVTDAWLGGRRDWYVGGSAPSGEAGGFTLPSAVRVTAQKDGDHVHVLDASGRVQELLLADRTSIANFDTAPSDAPVAGVGGRAHLAVGKGKVVVAVNDEVIVTDAAGGEIARWRLEVRDGSPVDVELQKSGKLLVGARSGLVQYNLDGFRDRTLATADALPAGFETYDLAYDEKGKLWAVTDNGWLVKFKKPGVAEFKVRFSTAAVPAPRLVVFDAVAWISSGDHVRRVDAIALYDEQVAAEAAP
jgi:hypothetical protein